jgi:hypothetical protein
MASSLQADEISPVPPIKSIFILSLAHFGQWFNWSAAGKIIFDKKNSQRSPDYAKTDQLIVAKGSL